MSKIKVLKLLNNETIMGDAEGVYTDDITQILVKMPYIAKNGNIMPYMMDEMMSAPAAVQIHPMNVLWSADLEDFPIAFKAYNDATSKILAPESNIII